MNTWHRMWLIALLALFLMAPQAVASEERPHNQAEGDNPGLDEALLQGIKKGGGTPSQSADSATSGAASSGAASSGAASSGGASSGAASSGGASTEAGAEAITGAAVADFSKLEPVVEKLVLEYYPKAKIKKGKDTLHVEFKARPYDIPSTNKIELGPDWSGLVFDMDLKPGPYAGVHAVPKKFNEYSFYVVELYAPFSKKFDRHLLTRICYPFDVPQEFLKRFKKLVDEFDQFL